MKFTNLLVIAAVAFTGCAKLERVIDGAEGLPKQIDQTNSGIQNTNENVRLQKVGILVTEMRKKENREYLTPIPGDMMPYGKLLADTLTVEEALLFVKDYVKKINEETFENRNNKKLTIEEFEHDKLADLMMITIISGYLPDSTLNRMIAQESEQGAYREILYNILMLRVVFNNDIMLNAGVMNQKLETVGKINKAIEYNDKVDFVAKLNFTDVIGMEVTGFSTAEMNAATSRKLDTSLAATNWNRILNAAQLDFKATSFATSPSDRAQAMAVQTSQYNQSVGVIRSYLKTWGVTAN